MTPMQAMEGSGLLVISPSPHAVVQGASEGRIRERYFVAFAERRCTEYEDRGLDPPKAADARTLPAPPLGYWQTPPKKRHDSNQSILIERHWRSIREIRDSPNTSYTKIHYGTNSSARGKLTACSTLT